MKTQKVKFSAVPVGAFFFLPYVGWMLKISRRRGAITPARITEYEPHASTIVEILA